MHLLYRIVYAAHSCGTHHKLALDALRRLECVDAERWQKLFLKHATLYLEGAMAPDAEFKDFKNHVLYPRDDYWGGAPEKVSSWYQHLVEALANKDWPTAVYCAGVLSHYYTDPLYPFHTAQSEAEHNIHRAVARSIANSYDRLRAEGKRDFAGLAVALPEDDSWLLTLVMSGARRANAAYEKLIAHYHLERGVVDPAAGLDRVGRRIIAELIRYAALSYALVLSRAITEAEVEPPQVSLTAATLLASLRVPIKLIERWIADGRERRAIERGYDELVATGKVERNLGEAERVVREVFAEEVLAKRRPPREVLPCKPRPRIVTRIDQTRAAARQAVTPGNVVAFAALPAPNTAAGGPGRAGAAAAQAALDRRVSDRPRQTLSLDQDVVDCPSIGPKTAKRLYPVGIKTVRDLMRADPTALSVLIAHRPITAETISGWQDQARLAATVPGLAGTHAQLLVAAGYHSATQIAAADPEKLCADILALALTAQGQRLLRDHRAPEAEEIKDWRRRARGIKAA
jgi:hypothetical protein